MISDSTLMILAFAPLIVVLITSTGMMVLHLVSALKTSNTFIKNSRYFFHIATAICLVSYYISVVEEVRLSTLTGTFPSFPIIPLVLFSLGYCLVMFKLLSTKK